jgi:hypothetical protein
MYFRVVTDRVAILASDLDSLASSFEAVAQRRVAHEGLSDARHVDEGLREYFGEWTDAMGKLHGQLATLASQLHGAVSTYEANERALSDAARGSGG